VSKSSVHGFRAVVVPPGHQLKWESPAELAGSERGIEEDLDSETLIMRKRDHGIDAIVGRALPTELLPLDQAPHLGSNPLVFEFRPTENPCRRIGFGIL
jgi:hypothetical protein